MSGNIEVKINESNASGTASQCWGGEQRWAGTDWCGGQASSQVVSSMEEELKVTG